MVAAAILDGLGAPSRLLAARRRTPVALAGGWELPGGKVEPGETPQQALVREIREELGVRLRLGPEVVNPAATTWPISDSLEMRVWLATVGHGHPQVGNPHDRLRWLSAGELFDVSWLPADVAVVHRLAQAHGLDGEAPRP